MTNMKDIVAMTDTDLVSFVDKKRDELRTHRFGSGGSNASAIKFMRKDIARAMTEMTKRANNVTNTSK